MGVHPQQDTLIRCRALVCYAKYIALIDVVGHNLLVV